MKNKKEEYKILERCGWESIQSALRDRFNLSVNNVDWTDGTNVMFANLPDGKMLTLGLSKYTKAERPFAIVEIMIYEIDDEEYKNIYESLPKDIIIGIALNRDYLFLCLKFSDFLGLKEPMSYF